MTTRFPVKDTAEDIVIGFDFSVECAFVSSPAVSVSVAWSAVPEQTPALELVGQPQIDANNPALVLQQVRGGSGVADYALRCTATPPAGGRLTVAAILPVRLLP